MLGPYQFCLHLFDPTGVAKATVKNGIGTVSP